MNIQTIMKKMKKAILVLVVLTLLISCSTQNNTSAKNEELIKTYVEAVQQKDDITMETLLAEQYRGFGPSANDSIDKVGAIENWKYNTENLYEGIKYNKSRIISVNVPDGENKGEWVSNWAELTITYKSGEKAVIWTNTVYQIENDKIIKSYTFYNEADVYKQLGYVIVANDNF